MSWSDSPALTMPFISYDISVTRNVYTNGSVTFDATATATLGELSHGDAVRSGVSTSILLVAQYLRKHHFRIQSNYYGWGDLNAEPTPHLAACGDLYAVSSADLFELFAIAKVSPWLLFRQRHHSQVQISPISTRFSDLMELGLSSLPMDRGRSQTCFLALR